MSDGWVTEENDGSFTPVAVPKGWVPSVSLVYERMTRSIGYLALMSEIRTHDWDDPWGTASDWYFATAGVVWMETGEYINSYCPSILYVQGDWDSDFKPDGYSTDRIREMLDNRETSLEDIKLVNNILTRYLGWAKLAGRDY